MNSAESENLEVNIDYSKYNDDELVNDISDLVVFPEYIFKAVILPILLGIALYIMGFFLLDMGITQTIIYAIIGFLLFTITGIFSGVYILISKLGTDIGNILDRTIQLTNKCLNDAEEKLENKSKLNRKKAAKNVLAGISQVVVLPSVFRVVENKLPIIGFIITGIINRIVSQFTRRVDVIEAKETNDLRDDAEIKVESPEIKFDKQDAVLTKVFKVVKLPFKIVLFILIGLLIIFLWIMN